MEICFFFQAEDGIRDDLVTGVQTCALPICRITPLAGGMMMGDSGRTSVSSRRARARGSHWRLAAGLASVALTGSGLAACGTSSAGTGPITLSYYLYPDSSGATQTAINNCDKQSGGKYTISYQQLPTGSDGPRQQMGRRLAAHDAPLDILGLDVSWGPELAHAARIVPWTGTDKAQAEAGPLG